MANTNSITLQTVVLVTDPDSPDVSDNPFSEVGVDDELAIDLSGQRRLGQTRADIRGEVRNGN